MTNSEGAESNNRVKSEIYKKVKIQLKVLQENFKIYNGRKEQRYEINLSISYETDIFFIRLQQYFDNFPFYFYFTYFFDS